MTNLEGRVILRQRALTPPAGVRTDLDVLAGLAARLGLAGAVRDRPRGGLRRARPGLGGREGRLLRHHLRPDPRGAGRVLAVPGRRRRRPRHAPDVPRLFATPDGRARFYVVDHRGPAEQPCADYPVHLTTGRVLAQYQSGAQTRRVRALPDDGAFVEMHPMLAARIGAVDGERRPGPTRRGDDDRAGPGRRHDPAGHGLRAVPLGRRQQAHQRRPRPGLADAGVQGVRGAGRRVARPIDRAAVPQRLVVVGNGMAPPGSSRSWSPRVRRPRHRARATSEPRRTTGSCCPRCSRAPTPATR